MVFNVRTMSPKDPLNAIGASSVEGVDWLEQMLGAMTKPGALPPQKCCHGILYGRPAVHYAPLIP